MADKEVRIRDHRHHPRDWRGFLYVYPVISRRSRGLSIGINLNPDAACNFDCIYCQVDRSGIPRVRTVDVDVLRRELDTLVEAAVSGSLFDEVEFSQTPAAARRLNDIAFSGDGEPTTCPQFLAAVEMVAELKRAARLDDVKTVLITDACYLMRPDVVRALAEMDASNGEIWAKLDAGTEDYYRLVNRPNYPLTHVMENIIHAARVRPVVVQSLFMRVHDVAPAEVEIDAYVGRLREVMDAGGGIDHVQVYTVARAPAQNYVTSLHDDEVQGIADRVRGGVGLRVEWYGG